MPDVKETNDWVLIHTIVDKSSIMTRLRVAQTQHEKKSQENSETNYGKLKMFYLQYGDK